MHNADPAIPPVPGAAPAGSVMRDEIHEQPDVLARLLSGAGAVVEAVAREAHTCSLAVLAARGSSDNASTYGKYLIESLAGLPAALAAPSLYTLYQAPPRTGRALAIGVSQSGEAADVAEVIAETRRQGAVTLGVTNMPGSLLARTAEHVILLNAGVEKALAATKTVSAQCLAYAMLALRMAKPGRVAETAGIDDVPRQAAAVLAQEADIRDQASHWLDARRVAVIGRGYAYGAAQELALKLKETSFINAEPYSSADFMHGPLAIIEPGYSVLVLLNHDATLEMNLALVEELVRRGADVWVVATRQAAERAPARARVLSVDAPNPLFSPISFIVAGQLFALHLSLLRGNNPDLSRGVSKVTVTR